MFLVGVSGNDPKNDFEIFLKNYAWILCVAVVAIIITTIIIIYVIKNKKRVPQGKKEVDDVNPLIEALGGKENILDISSTGSRLSVKLIDKEKINRESLQSLGVTSIVVMSDKLTLVTNVDNQKIVEKIKNLLQN